MEDLTGIDIYAVVVDVSQRNSTAKCLQQEISVDVIKVDYKQGTFEINLCGVYRLSNGVAGYGRRY